MSKTATLMQDGLYDLSEPIMPYRDGVAFSRVAIHVHDADDMRGTWVMGVSQEGTEHPAPLLQTPMVMEPGAALAVLGYTLA